MMFFYAEKRCGFEPPEKGVFLSIAEFAPYRALGWEGTKEVNEAADDYLYRLGKQELGLE